MRGALDGGAPRASRERVVRTTSATVEAGKSRPEVRLLDLQRLALRRVRERNRVAAAVATERGLDDRRGAVAADERAAVLEVALVAADLARVEAGLRGTADLDREHTH